MDDKQFSMIVLVFVFIVAIPSMIYLFSDNMGAGEAVIVGEMPQYLTNYAQNPAPYSYESRGVDVPIYDGVGKLIGYEKRIGSPRSQALSRPVAEGTYSGLKLEGKCPIGCVKLRAGFASDTDSTYVIEFNGYTCRCPR